MEERHTQGTIVSKCLSKVCLLCKCVFCEIIAGNSPAEVVMESNTSLCIKPLNPVTPGHLLVIPKVHVADALEHYKTTAQTMYETSEWAKLFSLTDERYVSCNLITSVGEPATQTVKHLHIHIVPRVQGDGLHLPWTGQRERQESDTEKD